MAFGNDELIGILSFTGEFVECNTLLIFKEPKTLLLQRILSSTFWDIILKLAGWLPHREKSGSGPLIRSISTLSNRFKLHIIHCISINNWNHY